MQKCLPCALEIDSSQLVDNQPTSCCYMTVLHYECRRTFFEATEVLLQFAPDNLRSHFVYHALHYLGVGLITLFNCHYDLVSVGERRAGERSELTGASSEELLTYVHLLHLILITEVRYLNLPRHLTLIVSQLSCVGGRRINQATFYSKQDCVCMTHQTTSTLHSSRRKR